MDSVGSDIGKFSTVSTQGSNLLVSTGLRVNLGVSSTARSEKLTIVTAPLSILIRVNLQFEVGLSPFSDNVSLSHFFCYERFYFLAV